MKKIETDATPPERWTLIRGARQLLTLRGASGPRRGSAMTELHAIHDGAVLIRNGVIEQMGPSRRVENLAPARKAREIDASGKLLMPVFVDPDGVLVYPGLSNRADPDEPDSQRESNLRFVTKRLLEHGAGAIAADRVRGGTLVIGAHTSYASNLRDTVKILRVHRVLQGKPLRIRSIVSPRLVGAGNEAQGRFILEVGEKWLPLIRKRKLASVIELNYTGEEGSLNYDQLRAMAVAAASLGFLIRIRSAVPFSGSLQKLAAEAGAACIIGFPSPNDFPGRSTSVINVLPASQPLADDRNYSQITRLAIENGVPMAIASSYRIRGMRSANPQYLLRLAMERFGLSEEEAITASTYNAACAVRMSHVTGSIEPGKSADLLLMDLPDYRELTRHIGHNDTMMVMRSGIPVYRRAPVGAEPAPA